MVQQPCLPPQAERKFEAPPEHQTSIVTPTLEEIVLRLTDTEVFSIREAKCGSWDVQWH